MEARFFAPVHTGPGSHPASCTMGTGYFPGGKERPERDADTPHPLLVPWSRKSTAIPLLPPGAVRPVQSISACTRVTFTYFTFCGTYWINRMCIGPCIIVVLQPAKRAPPKTSRTKAPTRNELRTRRPMW